MTAQLPHPRVQQWLRSNYPKPQLDPDWLKDCSEWLQNQEQCSPDSNFQRFTVLLENQLLSSDLRDSMLHGTGLPTHIALSTANTVLTGPPILVEIAAMTEIAHSAFNLEQVRAAIEERERFSGSLETNDVEGDIDVDEGPPPKYPRGMLRFELTDGATSLPAIEYRPLTNITLGVTPLGLKMHLRNVKIRNGIAWLEPETVVMKKQPEFTEDRQATEKFDFARGLRVRMRLPLEPVPQPAQELSSPQTRMRSPLQEIFSPPSEPSHNDDVILESRRRRIPPASANTQCNPLAPSLQSENRTLVPPSLAPAKGTRSNAASPSFLPSISQNGTQAFQAQGPLLAQLSIIDMTQDDMNEHVFTSQRGVQFIDSHRLHRSAPQVADWGQEVIPVIDKKRQESGTTQRARIGDAKGKERATETDDFDDFDENIFTVDQAFLESLDRVELEAMKGVGASKEPTPTLPPPLFSTNNVAHRRMAQEVIEIADDEDCEDKENVPVATRHVRRRTNTASQELGLADMDMSVDVIDLSDSD